MSEGQQTANQQPPQSLEPPVFQPDEEMLAILEKQAEAPITKSWFVGREGEVLTIVERDLEVPLTLVKVTDLERTVEVQPEEPASLLFTVERKYQVPQRLYRIRSEGHDDIVLFLCTVVGEPGDNDHHYLESILN